MSVFSTLRDYLRNLVRTDEAEAREPEKKAAPPVPVAKPVLRNQGDAFDAGPRGRRVDLSGGLDVPLLEVEEPPAEASFIPPSGFNASFDDLPALVDEPLGEQPEFIPEGGMSTQSLMREFDVLDPAIIPAPAEPVSTFFEAAALEESSFEAAPAAVQPQHLAAESSAPEQHQLSLGPEASAQSQQLAYQPVPSAQAQHLAAESAAPAQPEQLTPDSVVPALSQQLTPEMTAAPAQPQQLTTDSAAPAQTQQLTPDSAAPAQHQQFTTDSAAPAQPAFIELNPATAAAPQPQVAPMPPARPALEQEDERSAARLAPAWLLKPTTAAPKPAMPSTGSEFNASLDDLGLLPEEAAPTTESPLTAPSEANDEKKN